MNGSLQEGEEEEGGMSGQEEEEGGHEEEGMNGQDESTIHNKEEEIEVRNIWKLLIFSFFQSLVWEVQ